MLKLRDIALVILAGDRIKLSSLALESMAKQFSFDQTLIFANSFMLPPAGGKIIVKPFHSVEAATEIAWREILPRLDGNITHILSCHWDGYAINEEKWLDIFRDYDYIGAVWPWHKTHSVGNSGFSLQSKKFLEAIAPLEMRQPEDAILCREYRPFLEKERGILFAPETVADWFSIEHNPYHKNVFGFHGLWNMLHFLSDERVKEVLDLLAPSQWNNPQIDALATHAMANGRRSLYLHVLDKRMERKQADALLRS